MTQLINMNSHATIDIKGTKIKGFSFKVIGRMNPNAGLDANALGGPFGLPNQGKPLVDFSKIHVTATLHRKGKMFPIFQDDLQTLGCFCEFENSRYEYVRYGDTWEMDSEKGDVINIPLRITFPKCYDLTGSDYIELRVNIGSRFLVPNKIATTETVTLANIPFALVTAYDWSTPTKLDPVTTQLEVQALDSHEEEQEFGSYKLMTKQIETAKSNFWYQLGENVTKVHLINLKFPRLNTMGFQGIEGLRFLNTVEIDSMQWKRTSTERELISEKQGMFESHDDLFIRGNHHVLYDKGGRDADKVRVSAQLNPEHVTNSNTTLVWWQYYTDEQLFGRAASKAQAQANHVRKKILNKGRV